MPKKMYYQPVFQSRVMIESFCLHFLCAIFNLPANMQKNVNLRLHWKRNRVEGGFLRRALGGSGVA